MQVLAACLYPELVNSSKLPVDVRQRAQRLLSRCDGGSVGKSRVSCITLSTMKSQLAQFTKELPTFHLVSTAVRAERFFSCFSPICLKDFCHHRNTEKVN